MMNDQSKSPTVASQGGAVAALSVVPIATFALGHVGLAVWLGVGSAPTLSDVVVLVACAVGVATGLVLSLSAVAMVLTWGSERAHSVARRLAPPAWRRIVATALGATMAGSVAGPALAADDPEPATAGWLAAESSVATSGVENPDQATAARQATSPRIETSDQNPPPTRASAHSPDTSNEPDSPTETITVEAGDTLWDITAQELGRGATTADIAHAWPDLYEDNRDTIGGDPDVVQPGMTLRVPKEWQA